MADVARDPAADHARDLNSPLELLAPYRSLLLAVSGGPDSTALMLACASWPARSTHRIAVATVDHALRNESRGEAERVGAWAQALGFAHHLLTWEGEKPDTRFQERARKARYALLSDCAERIDAQAIVTAHHAEDQAETILFRLTRGSGVAGLAGMAPVSTLGGIRLLRPFLNVAKSELVERCARENHPYFLDPSNANHRFARVSLRTLAPLLAQQGLDRDSLLRLGARAALADAALAEMAHSTFGKALLNADETISFDANILRNAPREILQRTLALTIERIRPGSTARLERLERAAMRIAYALKEGAPLRLTLADVLFETRGDRVTAHVAPPRQLRR